MKWLKISGGALALALVLILAYFYHLAGKSIYYKYGKAHWQQSHPAECTPYRKSYFEDLGVTPIDHHCAETLNLPASSYFAQTPDGLKIHYRIFDGLSAAPILLHVSGITSDWLNGARYVKAAERMGFQLIAMEMRSHGSSDVDGKGVAYGCKENQDVVAVLHNLEERFPKRPVYLWGTSGATMAVLNAAPTLAKMPFVKALVLENPISSLADVAQTKSPGLPGFVYQGFLSMASWRAGVNFETCAAIRQAPKLRQPTLVTVAQTDTLTPVSMAEKVYAAVGSKSKVFKVYPQGQHERIWNGQPRAYEADLKAHWEQALASN